MTRNRAGNDPVPRDWALAVGLAQPDVMDFLALCCLAVDVVQADLPRTYRDQKEAGSQPVVTGGDALILLARPSLYCACDEVTTGEPLRSQGLSLSV